MDQKRSNMIPRIVAICGVLILIILIFGTLSTGKNAQRNTKDAVRSVSVLYLGELAGRREQVVEDSLAGNINVINIALEIMTDEDLNDLEHMRTYQRRMKHLFNLERFAFVDEDGLIYTADEGITNEIDQYSFDYSSMSKADISIKNLESENRKIVIAVPMRDREKFIDGKHLVVCFMEMDMTVMLQGVSMQSQSSSTTFSNIYTSGGIPLSNMVLGSFAAEDNLFAALQMAQFEEGYSLEGVKDDFSKGNKGITSFCYNGIYMTLSYVPVTGTDWFLTYMVRESVISEQINAVSDEIIRRSLIQTVLTTVLMGVMFAFVLVQMRKNTKLRLEKETSDIENRVKNEELEQRIALQEQILAQRTQQEQQKNMIAALSADYRSVYFIELDKDRGVCYQARSDLPGFKVGDRFNYLEAVTAYCNKYILPAYREEFLSFIRPEAVREGLKKSALISYRYMISIDGKESYEAVRFARVRRSDEAGDHGSDSVGACFADVDAETRSELSQKEALTEALTAAEQANVAKTAFLSNMSHEIRTPMNAIIGLNNIALNEPSLPPKIREYLLKMGASAQHLLSIINDILDMSRIESGRMSIKNEEFSFAKYLEQVNTIIGGQCSDKGLIYDCRILGKVDDTYIGDGMKLKQVMINILGNAVKFTPKGGKVTFIIEEIRQYDNKATLRLTFSDTGIGMSKEYLPHVFDTFSQENVSSTNKYGSTGLGMPITKSIIDLMNGQIEVESEKGVGTTFTVTVTLGKTESKRDDSNSDINLKTLNVLVIDDDPVALEHAQIVLGQVGIGCDVAASGEKGIELVKLRHGRMADYDLLLIDWKMPNMDGVETARQMRAVVGNETPIIILTAYNWDDVANEAIRAGVDSFVSKPLFAESVMDEFIEAFKQKSRTKVQKRADLKGRRVLLAEDMPVNAEIIIMVLSMREIEADLAENGRIAVEKFSEHPAGYYDAILMDMRMPEMDGLEATRTIRSMERKDAKEIPIIALTANAFDEDVQRSMQAGLNAHLSKPVEPEELFDTLEILIKD
ncbi:MAG: response regulator [Clostridia bacterium]|nr:response regulator [Clostridia bacterium]